MPADFAGQAIIASKAVHAARGGAEQGRLFGSSTGPTPLAPDLSSSTGGVSSAAQGSGASGEAAFNRGVGSDGQAVMGGGAEGLAENQVDVPDSSQAGRTVQSGARNQGVTITENGPSTSTGVGSIGQPPSSVSDAGASVEMNARGQVMTRGEAAGAPIDEADQARSAYVDPRGTAVTGATGTANAEAISHTGVDPVQTEQHAQFAAGAAADPALAAQNEATGAVSDREAAASASVGVGPTNRPEPKKSDS